MPATPAIIAEVPMFSLLDSNECATLAQPVETQHFDSGQNIFTTGDAGGLLYIATLEHTIWANSVYHFRSQKEISNEHQ